MKIDNFLLISGNDIPFIGARTTIHQPTLKELALLGEKEFFEAVQLLKFSKDVLVEEAKTDLEGVDDFNILMQILLNNSAQKSLVLSLLFLMFHGRDISIAPDYILISGDEETYINSENFPEFKQIVTKMFNMQMGEKNEELDYNPADEAARKIAEKLKKGRAKAAEIKSAQQSATSFFNEYISILSVGLPMDINQVLNCTFYQVQNLFKRFQRKQSFEIYLKAQFAGATGLDETPHWMESENSPS